MALPGASVPRGGEVPDAAVARDGLAHEALEALALLQRQLDLDRDLLALGAHERVGAVAVAAAWAALLRLGERAL